MRCTCAALLLAVVAVSASISAVQATSAVAISKSAPEHSAWYIDWDTWFSASTFKLPVGASVINIFVGKFGVDANGKPTVDGLGNMSPQQLDTFTAYCAKQSPPVAVKVSIGGGGGSYDNTWNVLTDANVPLYAQGLVDYCHAHGLAGIDFDYELYGNVPQQLQVGALIRSFKALDSSLQATLCTNAGFQQNSPQVQTIMDAASTGGVTTLDKLYVMSYYGTLADEQAWLNNWAQWLSSRYGMASNRLGVGIDDFDAHSYDPIVMFNWAVSMGYSTGHWAFDANTPTAVLVAPAASAPATTVVTTPAPVVVAPVTAPVVVPVPVVPAPVITVPVVVAPPSVPVVSTPIVVVPAPVIVPVTAPVPVIVTPVVPVPVVTPIVSSNAPATVVVTAPTPVVVAPVPVTPSVPVTAAAPVTVSAPIIITAPSAPTIATDSSMAPVVTAPVVPTPPVSASVDTSSTVVLTPTVSQQASTGRAAILSIATVTTDAPASSPSSSSNAAASDSSAAPATAPQSVSGSASSTGVGAINTNSQYVVSTSSASQAFPSISMTMLFLCLSLALTFTRQIL